MSKKKKIIIISVVAVLIILITIGLMYWFIFRENKQENDEVDLYLSEIFLDNGWDKKYIEDIVYEVPIPTGYQYVQGNKEKGLIVKDSKENYYMWIPYNKDAEVIGIDEYYKNVSNNASIDYESANSMVKYDGFYISIDIFSNEDLLSKYDKLKELDDETYNQLKETLEQQNVESDAVSSHLVSKRELEQIMYFVKTNNINTVKLGNIQNTYKIEKTSEVKLETEEIDYNLYEGMKVLYIKNWTLLGQHTDYVKNLGYINCLYKDNTGIERHIYIPEGFKIMKDKEGILKVQSETDENIVFVWVSVEDLPEDSMLETTHKFILDALEEYNESLPEDVKVRTPLEDIIATVSPDIEYSLKKFKGFYMAEGETYIKSDTGQIATRSTDTVNNQPSDGKYITNEYGEDILSLYQKFNQIAEKAEEQMDNENVTVAPASTATYEAVMAKEIKDKGTKEGINKTFVEFSGEYSKNSGTVSSPNNISIDQYPRYQGMTGFAGATSETTGNQDSTAKSGDNQLQVPFDENGEPIMETKTDDWTGTGAVTRGSAGAFDRLTNEQAKEKQEGTIGVRLTMFLSDINRHADYFKAQGHEMVLKDKDNLPENIDLIIPKKVEFGQGGYIDTDGLIVKCTDATKIKSVIDRIHSDIGENAYSGCTNLKSFTIDNISGGIGKNAFYGCSSLQSIDIKYTFNDIEELPDIGESVFEGCSALNEFVLEGIEIKTKTQGDAMQGGPMQGDPTQEGIMPGDPTQEGIMPGDPTQGGIMPGDPMQGGIMPGDPMQGGPMQGDPMQGDPTQEGIMPGDPTQGGHTEGDKEQKQVVRKVTQNFGTIHSKAFFGCHQLTKITFGDVCEFGSNVFSECINLKEIKIGNLENALIEWNNDSIESIEISNIENVGIGGKYIQGDFENRIFKWNNSISKIKVGTVTFEGKEGMINKVIFEEPGNSLESREELAKEWFKKGVFLEKFNLEEVWFWGVNQNGKKGIAKYLSGKFPNMDYVFEEIKNEEQNEEQKEEQREEQKEEQNEEQRGE